MKVLVTGNAGFIGYHLAKRLMRDGHIVTGLDNLNAYYDVKLKYARLADSGITLDNGETESANGNFRFFRMDLTDADAVSELFESGDFDTVVHLAAQAGVRYSLEHPQAYIDSNVTGFLNILEACRSYPVQHLIYASSSSVYGLNGEYPGKTSHRTDRPASLYAATKRADELMAHTYAHLFGIPVTGLRFFTVYGPWGRPDMAFFKFTESILNGKPIDVYNNGRMYRDFTYIDDIIDGIMRLISAPPDADENTDGIPYALYNIGRGEPVPLMDFIHAIESSCGKSAIIRYKPLQPGDVVRTHADISALSKRFGYEPATDIREGIRHFTEWYRHYYGS